MTARFAARLEVLAGGDALRRERLTRLLRDDLAHIDGLDLKLAPASAAAQGSKGAVESTVAILVAAAPFGRPTADLLKAVITGWLQRDRRTVLRATVGDRTVELTGDLTPDQLRALDALLRTPSDPDEAAQE
ncbi:MAG: hypothetical protein M3Y48_12805 [Actinomycetota bacterium]|nr:hypothetical protein [Actinomycetota bacterium]